MRTTRKILALLLAVAMVFTMTAMTALATGGDDGTTTPDSGTTTPGGDPTPDGGAPTTPGGGTTTPGGGPTAPDTPTPPGVSEQAQAVIALIAALPEFNKLTSDEEVAAYKARVSAAQAAYDALTEEQKAEVTNHETLTQAEAYLDGLTNITPRVTNVCQIGDDNQYATLQDAVAAVQPGETATITMLTDVTLTAAVTLPNGVTLDLNGKTISGAANMSSTITIDENATVTITDNLTGGGGKISNSKNTGSSSGAVIVEDGAALTLDGGVTLETTGGIPSSLYIYNKTNTPKVEIINAKFISKNYAIRLQSRSNDAIINIHDGEFQPGKQSFIYFNDAADVTISGGTFTKWDDDDMDLLAEGKAALVDGEGVTIGDTPESPYAQMGEKYYLISNNLYDLIKEDYVTGKTIQIVDDVFCTYHDGSYFGNSKGNAKTLTLDIAEGKTLSGKMPLGIAEVTVTGSGTLGENFFVPADETKYEVIESSPTTESKKYTGMVRVDNAAAFVIRDGASFAYTSVPDAINAAKTKSGSTVKLNQNYTTNTTVLASASDFQLWTLDLNGYTYTYTGSAQAFDIRFTKKSFTLTDSSETGGGKLIVTDSDPNAVAIRCEGSSDDNNVTIKEGATVEGTILIGGENNTLDVYGTIATGNKNTAIQTNGSSTKNSTITLHDGAIVTSESCAIYHPGTGTLNVYKATVTGGGTLTGIEMRAGTLNVYEGAVITGGNGEPSSTPNGSGTTTNNAAIAVAQHNTREAININIEGGTFTGGAAFYESTPQENSDIANVTIQIKGGTFTATDPNADSVYSENKTGFITGGKFSSDVKEYVADQHDQLVTNKETTPFWVGWYTDSNAADTMGQTVYKVTYNFDGESVDVYYMTEAEANKAIAEAEEDNVETKGPAAVKPTPSGGGSGSGSYLPVILSPSWSQTVSVVEHGTLTMSVRASGASSYQWYVDRGDGRFVAIAGATGDSLTIWPDMGDNGNRYYCRAKNGYGGVNSPYFTLCVVRSTLPPKTGDQVCVTLWVCLMALGVAGALTAWNRQRNR